MEWRSHRKRRHTAEKETEGGGADKTPPGSTSGVITPLMSRETT